MNFNNHSMLSGRHATLSASNYHWLNYDSEKMAQVYNNQMAKQRGTELHDLAERCIRLGQKLPRSRKTLNMYVNDAIGFKMDPEQILYYSDNCFGTADSICFRNSHLRIHDLKTGVTPAHMEQLLIYTALFCLEYGPLYNFKPNDISVELRIYQNDEIIVHEPAVDEIVPIMDKIISFDKLLNDIKKEG